MKKKTAKKKTAMKPAKKKTAKKAGKKKKSGTGWSGELVKR